MSASYIANSPYLAKPGAGFTLADRPTRVDIYDKKSAARDAIKDNAKAISGLAHRLYGEADRKLLIVLQGMDTSGKDGTTSAIFHRTPPLNVKVASFKSPTKTELAHDYLWRVHNVMPGKGQITVFNRSHYEDVLVVKVKNYVQRYDHINDFERLLTETGTTVLKFMLHISPETQGERLRDRLINPDKRWKFNPGDLDDRALWPDFMEAYETMVQRTSTKHAPWHIMKMDPQYPDPGYRPDDFDIT